MTATLPCKSNPNPASAESPMELRNASNSAAGASSRRASADDRTAKLAASPSQGVRDGTGRLVRFMLLPVVFRDYATVGKVSARKIT